jgi:hypothetical protein
MHADVLIGTSVAGLTMIVYIGPGGTWRKFHRIWRLPQSRTEGGQIPARPSHRLNRPSSSCHPNVEATGVRDHLLAEAVRR